MTIRKAVPADVAGMHRVRLAVTENRLSRSVITADDYLNEISVTGCGWVAEVDGVLRGFAVGNRVRSNIWALFVEPGFERRGIGRALHDEMMRWMRSAGCRTVWLETDPETRAAAFYREAGWQFVHLTPEGDARFEMHFS